MELGSNVMRADILVVGGGLAGAAVATHLARAGREVVLLERAKEPQHKVCGEFLSTEALAYLAQLGMDAAPLGAVPVRTVRMHCGKRVSEMQLPFAAMSLTRRCLDETLLHMAEAAGARVLRGVTAGRIERCGEQWHAQGANEVKADAVFLATGKHDVNGRPRPQGKQGDLVGVKMYVRLTPEQMRSLGENVELFTYRGGYGGLQPVEDGLVNLCCLVPRAMLRETGGALWPELRGLLESASPHLAKRLGGAEALLPRPLAIAPIPYGFVRSRALGAGLWALGDQAAVIPSFTGDGMSIALHSAALAAQMYLRGASAGGFQRRLHDDVARQVRVATALSRMLVRFPRAALTLAGVWPGLLHHVAQRTRIDAEVRLA